jgi:hypothetical protein
MSLFFCPSCKKKKESKRRDKEERDESKGGYVCTLTWMVHEPHCNYSIRVEQCATPVVVLSPSTLSSHSNNRGNRNSPRTLSLSRFSRRFGVCVRALFTFSCRWLLPSVSVSVSAPLVPLRLRSRLVASTERRLDFCLTHSSLSLLLLSYYNPSPKRTRFFFPTYESVYSLSFQSRPVRVAQLVHLVSLFFSGSH